MSRSLPVKVDPVNYVNAGSSELTTAKNVDPSLSAEPLGVDIVGNGHQPHLLTVTTNGISVEASTNSLSALISEPISIPHLLYSSQHISDDRKFPVSKLITPLRKRGQSFRETRRVNVTVDADGRWHLNQYTFMEQLGKGAYGVVYKVICNETKNMFAAKCMNKKALQRIRVGRFGNALQSITKELEIWKQLKHRHIVVLREVITTDDCDELYMISELIDGGPVLNDAILCTPLKADLTKTYFTHLIEGIAFLHKNKIIHRDIKPGNLLLKTKNKHGAILKIADFGVSHELEHDNEVMRQTAGTAIFMAPEMLTGGSFHGKPADIWACGVTLFMFVYGYPPFIAQTVTVLYNKIQNEIVKFPTRVGDRVIEDELIDLMQHMLEKDPTQRYTSQQIRSHPWAWREFQISAVNCVIQPEERILPLYKILRSLTGIASLGKTCMQKLFSRSSIVYPADNNIMYKPCEIARSNQLLLSMYISSVWWTTLQSQYFASDVPSCS
ncbi:putative protein kinase [Plasmopara halstedii]